MSLILEALKKLEREKQVPERGVVVVGATAWPGARGERRLGLFLLGLLLGAGLLGVARWRQAVVATPAPLAPAAAAVPAPAPSRPAEAPSAQPHAPPRMPAATPAAAEAASRPSAPTFTLQAISEREGRPVAIVNDRLLREGDSIDGARIVRIAKDEVELELAGRRVLLRF